MIYRYERCLNDAKKCGIRKGLASGVTTGVTTFLQYCIYALGIFLISLLFLTLTTISFMTGFWYGTKLVWEENYSIGDVFTVSICSHYISFHKFL